MRVTLAEHPDWSPETWAHIEQRRAERRAAGIVFTPDRETRRLRRQVYARDRPSFQTLHVEVGVYTAWLRGEDVADLLDAAGVTTRKWDDDQRAWMVPADLADAVMSWAEWRQRRIVTCTDVDR